MLFSLSLRAAIREEIREIEAGEYDSKNNVLKVKHCISF